MRIDFFGVVKSPTGERSLAVDVGEGETLARILVEHAGFRVRDLKTLTVLVNGKRIPHGERVRPGALIEVFLPAGGG
ncbi:MAG: MoaD/ThiS family protein [Planctomycetota bacterium]